MTENTVFRRAAAGIAAALGAALLLLAGNTHEPQTYGPSIASWLFRQWTAAGSRSAHGWIIPLFSLFVVWRDRRELLAATRRPAPAALLLIGPALVLYWIGCRTQQPRLGVLCMIILSWSVPLYLFGMSVARRLVFPSLFLVLAVPLGFLEAFTFPLRLAASAGSASLLNGVGIGVRRMGTAIVATGGHELWLEVADRCSGLNSVIAMIALTAGYAQLTQPTLLRKGLLFLCAVPLAMAGNIVRIFTIGVVGHTFGMKTAQQVYHDYSGYIVFATAILLMMAIGSLLNRIARRLDARCSPPPQPGT